MKRSLILDFVLFLFLAVPSKANPVDPVTTQSSLGAGSLDAPDTFGRQHGDIDDSQASVAETAEKLEIEHIESNSKVDILEKELSAIPPLAKLFYEAMKQLEDSVKQVQKTANENSEKVKSNTDAVQKIKDAIVHNTEVINRNQKELEKLKTNTGEQSTTTPTSTTPTTTLAPMVEEHWIVTENTNCYSAPNGDYFGAEDIEPDPWRTNSDIKTCKRSCVALQNECTGFIWGTTTHNCHLKKHINPQKCYHVTDGDLYQLELY